METCIDEIAPDLFRLSTYIARNNLQFNQFLVTDDEPLLYHTGLRRIFPQVRAAVASVMDPARIRWIGFSHFEADECGSLNEWLALAPQAKPVCGKIGALVNINDFIGGRAHVMSTGEVLATGRYRFQFLETPQVPHAWDASLLFEEISATLFCSDLFLQTGEHCALTEEDVVKTARQSLLAYEKGPLHHAYPYAAWTDTTLQMLAGLRPKLLAIMHGSSYRGDGARALRQLAAMYASTLGEAEKEWERQPGRT
jgi:flavorubredoxin